jgi:hypothetical protein
VCKQTRHTGEGHLGEHQQIQALDVSRIDPVQDSIRTVQIVVDITHLRGELETADPHCGSGALDPGVGNVRSGDVAETRVGVFESCAVLCRRDLCSSGGADDTQINLDGAVLAKQVYCWV